MTKETKYKLQAIWKYPYCLAITPIISRLGTEADKRELKEIKKAHVAALLGKRFS